MRWANLLLLVLLPASICLGSEREYQPGDAVDLKPGNGLVALDILSDGAARSVKIEQVGSLFGSTKLSGLGAGRNIRLVELPAGEYRWARVDLLFNYYLGVRDDPRFRFTVTPGAITYAGEFALTQNGGFFSYNLAVVNQTAQMMVDLDRAFPGIRSKYSMQYRGPFPDRFVQFAGAELKEMLAIDALKAGDSRPVKIAKSDTTPEFDQLVTELFSPDEIGYVRLNPAGDLIALSEYRDGKCRLSILDPVTQLRSEVYAGTSAVRDLHWAGNRTLLVGLNYAENSNYVIHVQFNSGGAPAFTQFVIPGRGAFSDVSSGDGARTIYTHANSNGAVHVYQINIGGTRFEPSNFNDEHRLDKGLNQAFFGLADASGALRVALQVNDGRYRLMYRSGGSSASWKEIHSYDADQRFEPVMLSADAKILYVLTNEGRSQTDLVRMALPGDDLSDTVFSSPGRDVEGVLTRPSDRSIVGVFLYQDGRADVTYLDAPDETLHKALAADLHDKSIAIYDRSESGERTLIYAYDDADPGVLYLHDAKTNATQKIVAIKPSMPHVLAARSRTFRATSADSTSIESYLTLPPKAKAPYPLIVMPHGGPIGVRDAVHFNPIVQLLANRGYAVLRVNYRGSEGFGRAFEQAGFGAWGTRIEDDILASIDLVSKTEAIDVGRVALRGASYGGYSTLMGLIRTPQRFRCGIAASAVTDLPLMFTSSDWAQSKRLRDYMMRIVGDPTKTLNEMEAVSPDYLYRNLTKPLLLIHGARDTRVPIEHALRLVMLLGHAKNPPQTLFFPKEGHGIGDSQDRYLVEAAADKFLGACMSASPSVAAH